MKKFLVFLGVVVVIGGGVGLVILTRPNTAHAPQAPASSTKTTAASTAGGKTACTIYTAADAQKLLGSTTQAGSSNADTPTESDAIKVSTCTYIQDTGDSLDSLKTAKTASLLVRAPKTQAGTDSNKAQFTTSKPAGVTDVPGYGDAAYWDPQFGQLNILKNNTWYILSYGTTTISSRTLDDGKQFAAILITKL